jgi:hypothetical protein
MRKIIAFAGPKTSGKTTAMEALGAKYRDVHGLALAGHLKDVCAKIFSLDQKLFHDQNLKEADLAEYVELTPKKIEDIFILFGLGDNDYNYDEHIRPHIGAILETPRRLLQYIGTEVLHPIDPLIHAKFLVKNLLPESGIVVLTDLRFKNEFEFFKTNYAKEFVPFHINSTRAEMAAAGDKHPSEMQRHEFKADCIQLDNNSTLYAFKDLVRKNLEEVYHA